jgi:hypothetical protein
MKQNKGHLIFWEMVLILGSIPVFRGVWMLCDGIEFMNQLAGIVLSFVAGISLCVIALIGLNRPDKEQKSDSRDDSLRQKN